MAAFKRARIAARNPIADAPACGLDADFGHAATDGVGGFDQNFVGREGFEGKFAASDLVWGFKNNNFCFFHALFLKAQLHQALISAIEHNRAFATRGEALRRVKMG